MNRWMEIERSVFICRDIQLEPSTFRLIQLYNTTILYQGRLYKRGRGHGDYSPPLFLDKWKLWFKERFFLLEIRIFYSSLITHKGTDVNRTSVGITWLSDHCIKCTPIYRVISTIHNSTLLTFIWETISSFIIFNKFKS